MRDARKGAYTGHIIKPVTNVDDWSLMPLGNRDPVAGMYLTIIPPKVQGSCGIHPSTPISPCLRTAPEVGGNN